MQETKDSIVAVLKSKKFFTINFLKADNSVREAHGTLDMEYILKRWTPVESNKPYEEPDNVIKYFDVEADGWRSFRIDRYLGVVE